MVPVQRTVILLSALIFLAALTLSSCVSNAASAEEYFDIGMAFYELGRYDEAERWLNRAKSVDKTMTASEYNLGRIAFAAGRYNDAAVHFESILSKDPDNVMALKGAAYSRIKNGDLDRAREHYAKVLVLIPESADDGYNYALVLYAMDDFQACEDVLRKYDRSLEEDNDVLLLLARAQGAAGKPEAADSYEKLLINSTNPNPLVNYEYGKILEKLELYARAVEQFRAGLAAAETGTGFPQTKDLLFEIGRVLIIADPESDEGIAELKAAQEAGFDNTEALEELYADSRISDSHKESIWRIIESINSHMPVVEVEETESETTDVKEEEEDTIEEG